MKSMSDLEKKVFNMALPLAKEAGLDLLEVEYKTHNKMKVLSLVIDKIGGVDLDDCATLSGMIDPILDEEDIIKGEYNLEVTSPGVDRQLNFDDDLKRNIGVLLEITLFVHQDKKLKFEGVLENYDSENITITLDEPFVKGVKPKTNGTQRTFARNEIKSLKKAIRF